MPNIKPTFTMPEIDEFDRKQAVYTLFSKLKKAEKRADMEGWISAEELEKELKTADGRNSL